MRVKCSAGCLRTFHRQMIVTKILTSSLAISALVTLASAAQLPLSFNRPTTDLHPESSTSAISHEGFTTLSHPDFKEHSIRIKNTTGWCDPDTRSFVGYIDNGPRHRKYPSPLPLLLGDVRSPIVPSLSVFFYYFDSRRDPSKDDLVLWTNGGPGCSSSMGLFMELGPCTTQPSGNTTLPNPYSWTNIANMIFIDQPIGVGYSYSDSGVKVGTSEEAAIDVHAFLTIFIESFPEFKGRKFHLSGESYGGRYLPVFATEILYRNEKLAKKTDSKVAPINLQSVLIGNGLTDVVSMTTSYYDQACTAANGVGHPVLDVKACMEMQQAVKRCDKWLEAKCRVSEQQPECDIATAYCGEAFTSPFLRGEINPYDISKPCTTLGEDLCYPETSVIKTYLDQPWVRTKLGVHLGIGPFQSCSGKVGNNFGLTRDEMQPTFFHLTGLLERGVKVLIYVGELDWICNFIGNYRMIDALQWSGQSGFVGTPLREWFAGKNESQPAGVAKRFGDLTFATIKNAGHMVPLDKPQEALVMVQRWLGGEEL
ncbi:peptidase S10, serine carboxypeptidase [Meredithblackwellia eburnea MCA 4105]